MHINANIILHLVSHECSKSVCNVCVSDRFYTWTFVCTFFLDICLFVWVCTISSGCWCTIRQCKNPAIVLSQTWLEHDSSNPWYIIVTLTHTLKTKINSLGYFCPHYPLLAAIRTLPVHTIPHVLFLATVKSLSKWRHNMSTSNKIFIGIHFW